MPCPWPMPGPLTACAARLSIQWLLSHADAHPLLRDLLMHPEAPSSNHDPVKSLPPVQPPPSAAHIIKLFVVPLLIVLGVVGIAVLVMWGLGGGRTPSGFLADLRSTNPDVRWRAAQDLAQVLLRDDWLASEPGLGLDLAVEL